MKTARAIDLRPMRRGDFTRVLEIEAACFRCPWDRDELTSVFNRTRTLSLVLEFERDVIAHMVVDLRRERLRVLNLAVAPEHQQNGAGSLMLDWIKGHAAGRHIREIAALIEEENLVAQKFFAANGFRAYQVLHGWFSGGEDAYAFAHRVRVPEFLEV